MYDFNRMLREFILFSYYFRIRDSFVLHIAHKCRRTFNVINWQLKTYDNSK